MRTGHIRLYERKPDYRIGRLRQQVSARTVCGAEPTSWDFTRAEALRLLHGAAQGCPDEQFYVCARCAAIAKAGG